MSADQLPALGSAAAATWIVWKLIKPVIRWVMLLLALLVLMWSTVTVNGKHLINLNSCPIPVACDLLRHDQTSTDVS